MPDILKKIDLLYVEDEASVRDVYSRVLSKMVKNLYVAENGEEGYQKYLENRPDIVVTDIKMPKLDGLQMSKKIRETDKNIPIIVTSAHNETDFFLESIQTQISGYIIKPVDMDKLFEMLTMQAKNLLFEKEQQKDNELLQGIMDAENNILIVSSRNELIFANKAFLKFLDVKNKEELIEKSGQISNMFIDRDGFLHNGLLKENESFIELLLRSSNIQKKVLMADSLNKSVLKTFYIDIAAFGDANDKVYLLNFTDITQMEIEKKKIEEKAYIDSLTGVYNRNKFDEVLDYEVKQAKRYHSSLSIAIVDIDHFKQFNDTYGHLLGDEVLSLLAKTIQKNIRDTDVFARWGGEEFVVLMPSTNINEAKTAADHLRKKVEQIELKDIGGITASFGVTQFLEHDNEEELFKRADRALYKAKENGRNCVKSS
ncbi:MAG: diguanylate cyclase [Sulfurimonas sp.]|nr:diguanylate cyclase [Sulfurimonas sp.]